MGTEKRTLKIIIMQEQDSKISEFESEIEEKFGENHPVSVIQCMKVIIRINRACNKCTQII